jgi:hypothetical protein
MAVYVDDMNLQADVPNGRRTLRASWNHLFADTEAELRAFAAQIGLKPEWIQDPGGRHVHFDVTTGKRQQAIARGAKAVTWREAGEFFARKAAEEKAEREAQPVKRHRWPKREPGDCRAHDQCLDCGTWMNEAKSGGHPCRPQQADADRQAVTTQQRHSWSADGTPPGNVRICGRDGCGMRAERRAHPTEKRWITIYSKGDRRIISERVPRCGDELPQGISAEEMAHLAEAADRQAVIAYKQGDLDRAFRLLTDARVLDPGCGELWDSHEQRIREAAKHRQAQAPGERPAMDSAEVQAEIRKIHEWNKAVGVRQPAMGREGEGAA